MGEGQKAHFDDIDYSGFANIDPAHSKYTMDDELIVSTGRMCYRLAKGFLGGMLEAIGPYRGNADHEGGTWLPVLRSPIAHVKNIHRITITNIISVVLAKSK